MKNSTLQNVLGPSFLTLFSVHNPSPGTPDERKVAVGSRFVEGMNLVIDHVNAKIKVRWQKNAMLIILVYSDNTRKNAIVCSVMKERIHSFRYGQYFGILLFVNRLIGRIFFRCLRMKRL